MKEEPIDIKFQGALTLPVRGNWFVVNGGRSPTLNSHWEYPDQKYAVDLIVLGKNGASHKGDGRILEQYHAFKRPVYAAAPGTVVRVISDLPDNGIGETDDSKIDGNHVMIAHQDGTFALYDHLQRGSVTVNVGETVEIGKVIGRVGNSGNTTEPHLHFQIQATDDLDPQSAISMPMIFQSFTANEAYIDRGELPWGVFVRHGHR